MSNYSFDETQVLTTTEQLRTLYGEPSAGALAKELNYISPTYAQFIQASGFAIIGSVGPEGLDTSPRGDAPGFITVVDEHTLMLPDRRGNNRADTLNNIIRDPRVSLLFLIPGIGETLRVIGTARVVVDEALCQQFVVQGKAPRSVIVIDVQKVYFQCQKAISRSGLWQASSHVDREKVPTAGQMLAAVDADFDGQAYDAAYPEREKQTIY